MNRLLLARYQRQSNECWYTRREGVMRGPFSAENISRYILLGRIRLDDELSQDRTNWSVAGQLASLLPSELASQSSLDDYQQLVVAHMQADERKGERRCQNCGNCNPERRKAPNRRGKADNILLSHYLFSGVMPACEKRQDSRYLRPLLLTMLLVTLMFVWLSPIQS
jgi:hypothetical protein